MNYEARLTRLEQAIKPESLVVTVRQFGNGELVGLSCNQPGLSYFQRKAQESEEAFHDRAVGEAEKIGVLVVLIEDRA